MRQSVFLFAGVILFSGFSSSWAYEQTPETRTRVVEQALDVFDRSEHRFTVIREALEAFERSSQMQAQRIPRSGHEPISGEEESLSVRDMKIINALQRLERAQIEPAQEAPDVEMIPEKIRVRPPMVLRGQLLSEAAAHIHKPQKLTKFKNQISLTAAGEMTPVLRYRVSGRAHYDAVYDIEDDYSHSAKSDQRFEAELRETYVDYSMGNWDFRLGKQQIVWGEAIALFVADVVNAKDLREFILPDFDSIRIPEWGINTEYTYENFNSQFFILPGIEFNKLGVAGSEFVLPLPISPGGSVTYQDPQEPKNALDNSKIGTRFNYLLNGVDMGVFYLHSWTQSPVLYRTIDIGGYHFDPSYRRLDTFGTTVSKEISDIVFKGDFVYTKDDYFSDLDTTNSSGVSRSSHFDYLLGADYTFFNHLDVSAQFTQRIIQDFKDSYFGEDKYNNTFSLRVSREFWNHKLLAEILTVYGMSAPDFMYRPKVRYNLSDSLQMSIGADIFSGQPSGLLGYYRNQSRYYSELLYKF